MRPAVTYKSYNLTIERDLGKGIVLESGYVGSKGTHLSREYNINQPLRSIPNYMAFGTAFPTLYPPLRHYHLLCVRPNYLQRRPVYPSQTIQRQRLLLTQLHV